MPENVVVCGGREYDNRPLMIDWLNLLLERTDVVWHGGARGADTLAGEVAELLGHDVVIVPAQWKRFQKAAGPIRNQRMLELSTPRLVIAFPGGRGTADMVGRSRKNGIQTKEIPS